MFKKLNRTYYQKTPLLWYFTQLFLTIKTNKFFKRNNDNYNINSLKNKKENILENQINKQNNSKSININTQEYKYFKYSKFIE